MKAKRVVKWVVTSAGIAACAYYGLFGGVAWAENVFLFLLWTNTVMLTVVAYHEESKLKLRAKGPSVPLWMLTCYDLALMLALASVGRFFAAAAMLWQLTLWMNVFKADEKEEEEPACAS